MRYLESRLIKLAQDARRANLTNDTAPEPASLPEPDVADMEFFIEQVQMILPVLGFDFTQPRVGQRRGGSESPVFELRKVGAVATAREIDGQFVVLKGSTARKKGPSSWRSYKGLRQKLVAEGLMVDSPDPSLLAFPDDVPFDSPSAAASVIVGLGTNGRETWKILGTGQSYAQWQEEKLAKAGVVADDEPDE